MSCSNCQVDLAGVEFVEHDGKDLCVACYNSLFGKTCAQCHTLIPVGAKFAKHDARFWHKQCFQCASCKTQLAKFQVGDNDQFYCHTCYKEQCGPKCVVCHKVIVMGLRHVETDGQSFHEDCFRCSSKACGKKLENGFTRKENEFFCPECCREMISKRTFTKTVTHLNPILSELFDEEQKVMESTARSLKTELTPIIQSSTRLLLIPKVSKEKLLLTSADQTQTVSHLFPSIVIATSAHNGSIQLRSGDLTKQNVDVIVVCSTSEALLKSVLQQAGLVVENEYTRLSAMTTKQNSIIETGPGNLSCKAIFFHPWIPPPGSDATKLATSVSEYTSKLLDHILHHPKVYRTVAFPSIDCASTRCSPDIVAKSMIDVAVKKLADTMLYFTISFVISPAAFHMHQKFAEKLVSIQKPSEPFGQVEHSFSQFTLTLTAKQEVNVKQCHSSIEAHVSTCTQVKSRENDDLGVWTQQLVLSFYQYCLARRVWPSINFQQKKVTLNGKKDSVDEADRHFLELTNQALKQTHLESISRSVLWEYQSDPTTWQSYSYKCIGEIEYAFSVRKLTTLEILNDQDERCRIDFAQNTETCDLRTRFVRRRPLVSVSLPTHWQCQSANCSRFILNEDSEEFKNIKQRFDQTMANLYNRIISIERIQNQRWYKQYVAHREAMHDRLKENTEKQLFHGCAETAANSIMEECFNRSFAGINGVVYGKGAYFATNAKYSNTYAHANQAGERRMFVVSVLVGKSAYGDPSMKVPPAGYDSTTDSKEIFVVYHDAQAYADYLIKYQ